MENKRKHLEFIQNVITRMNSNSFLIKGWAITLVSALFALAAKDANLNYVLITYIAIPLFWGLDGYFLSQERQYRSLYDHVAGVEENLINFSMNASGYNTGRNRWVCTMISKTIWPLYTIMFLITLSVMYFFKATPNG